VRLGRSGNRDTRDLGIAESGGKGVGKRDCRTEAFKETLLFSIRVTDEFKCAKILEVPYEVFSPVTGAYAGNFWPSLL
jgi:hypothetical protein